MNLSIMECRILILILLFFFVTSTKYLRLQPKTLSNNLVNFYGNKVSIRGSGVLKNLKFQKVLVKVRKQARAECEARFLYDMWNCSLRFGRTNLLTSGYYRETATLTALASASVFQAVFRGCSSGVLRACTDASTLGRRLARMLFGGGTPLNRYNTQLGIEMMLSTRTRICKCHGVSGSCTTTTCWHVPGPLSKLMDILHQRYHIGANKQPISNEATQKRPPRPNANSNLIYLDDSPDFCANGQLRGRRCQNPDNCDTVCCARGFITQKMENWRRCNCKFISYALQVRCQNCLEYQKVHYCK